jgi:hypothetical protein
MHDFEIWLTGGEPNDKRRVSFQRVHGNWICELSDRTYDGARRVVIRSGATAQNAARDAIAAWVQL